MSGNKFSYKVYADDATLDATVDLLINIGQKLVAKNM